MRIAYVKAALMASWVLAVGGLGYGFGTTSFAGWTVVAMLVVLPPVLITRLWSGPSPSMSESIREVLR
jgi:hypothetical protein